MNLRLPAPVLMRKCEIKMQPVYIILEYCVENLDAMVCIMQGG